MASTRNNNTKGDYCLRQRSIKQQRDHIEYVNGPSGSAYDPALPCLGFNPSHMPAATFSKNPVEIESSLFGINSTNLVNPAPAVVPQLKTLRETKFFDRMPLVMPLDLVIPNNQRAFPVPE